jgi:hypothetical protein
MAKFDNRDIKALDALSKDDLVQFLCKKAINAKRELEKKLFVEKHIQETVHTYEQYLQAQPRAPGDREQRVLADIEGKTKQIEMIKKERAELKLQYDNLDKPRKAALGEKAKAQSEMTKRRIKSVYKYFEKKSDVLPIAIMECFVAVLRGKSPKENEYGTKQVGPIDVEYYLRKHQSLMVACNKMDPTEIDRTLAKSYMDILMEYNEQIKNPKFTRFVPFYVWIDQICQLVKIGVDMRELKIKMDEVDERIKEQQVEIDKKRVILAYLNCDPDSQKENTTMSKLWDGETRAIHSQLDQDNQMLQNFDSQYVGKIKSL